MGYFVSWDFSRKLRRDRRAAAVQAKQWIIKLNAPQATEVDRRAFVSWFCESRIHQEQFVVCACANQADVILDQLSESSEFKPFAHS